MKENGLRKIDRIFSEGLSTETADRGNLNEK
jgi:hypothetical protein